MPSVNITGELLRILAYRKAQGEESLVISAENQRYLQDRCGESGPSCSPGQYTTASAPQSKSAETPESSVTHSDGAALAQKADTPATPPSDSTEKMDWTALNTAIETCRKCSLSRVRTHTMTGAGSYNAELMFIGEAPAEEEDNEGSPFAGDAGRQLERMIAAMQYTRDEVFLANIVKCRPPGNRMPHPVEIKQCLPYLLRQIQLVQPRVLVLLGATPLRDLTGATSINKEHGQWCKVQGIPAVPTFHPAFLLRSPAKKRDAWEDLQKVMHFLGKDPKETKRRRTT